MRNYLFSCIYLTRRCPLHCSYCRIRDSDVKKELNIDEWKYVFTILEKLGTEFNLILGNETLCLGDDLVELIKFLKGKTPYGIYSTSPSGMFEKYRDQLVESGLYNWSSGIDSFQVKDFSDIELKAVRGKNGLLYMRERGVPDLQAQITISQMNVEQIPHMVKFFTDNKIWCGFNVIHYAKDDEYDFFPPRDEIQTLVFSPEDKIRLFELSQDLKQMIYEGYMIQNPPEYFDALPHYSISLNWHCRHPLILTIDADGSLRCCAYRKGKLSPTYSIFEMPDKFEKFKQDWKVDSESCPGCFWSYLWMVEFHMLTDKETGIKMFQTHETKYHEGSKI